MGKGTNTNWEPNPGETLVGTLTDAMVVPTNKWGDTGLAVITEPFDDPDTGASALSNSKVAVWLSRSMLATLFDDQRPALGSFITLRYHGTKASRSSGRTYHRYSMTASQSMPPSGNDWITDITTELETRKTHIYS